jgi:HSP20 family protein
MKLARRRQDTGTLAPFRQGLWSPFAELNRLREEINRVFEQPGQGFLERSTGFFGGWSPSLDVFDDKDNVIVKAELPGMKKEDIEVTLAGDTLTISGERKEEVENKDAETYRSERYFGRFQRSVTLPHQVDPNRIQATYKDGILTVTLSKSEEAKRKQIEVKVS